MNVVLSSAVAADHQSRHEPPPSSNSKSNDGRSVSCLVSHSNSPQRSSLYSGSPGPYSSPRNDYGSTSPDAFRSPRSSVTASPERLRRSDSGTVLNVVPEDRIMMEFSSDEDVRTSRYTGGIPMHGDDDEPDSEEEEWELDEELEERGLYRGSYHRLMALYTLTPITSLLFFALLAALPTFVYPLKQPWPYPSVPYLPHPVPELLTSAALFSLAHLLREPLATITTYLFSNSPSSVPAAVSTAIHTVLSLALQQSALPILLIARYAPPHPKTHDAAFRRVWWLALGWAAAEAVVAVAQGYAARALYRDVMVSVRRSASAEPDMDVDVEAEANVGNGGPKPEARPLGPIGGSGLGSGSGSRSPQTPRARDKTSANGQGVVGLFEGVVEPGLFTQRTFSEEDMEDAGEWEPLLSGRRDGEDGSAIKMQVEDELEALVAIRAREELEEAYGVPIIHIPVFLSCLQRMNIMLLTLGIYLLLSQAYLRSTLATTVTSRYSSRPRALADRSNVALAVAVPLCVVIQLSLALLQTPPLLPRVGAPAAVYSASLVSLGVFFAGLAAWEGLS
ncbi:hypothetical protein FPV67DRAFT_214518 [Lyophyllum atratum]|nr:hypothetical protein FPV67DRAFT_214518 [Lyophyllum atratum]